MAHYLKNNSDKIEIKDNQGHGYDIFVNNKLIGGTVYDDDFGDYRLILEL